MLQESTTDERWEAALNNLARHDTIRRLLADILLDMTVAKEIRHTDPMEYPIMVKNEIDRIVELWKQKEHAKDASGSTAASSANRNTERNTEGLA